MGCSLEHGAGRVAASGLVRPVPFDASAVTAAFVDVLQLR
jgi:hypothetical protein